MTIRFFVYLEVRIINTRKVSAQPVIDSGREQIHALQKNMYLHNFPMNYQLIGQAEPFSAVDISLMNKIGEEILKKQRAREKRIYKALNITNEYELNQLLAPYENQDLINTTVEELLNKACNKAFDNLEKANRNKSTEKQLEAVVNDVLYDILQVDTEQDKQKYQTLVDGLGMKVVGMLQQSAQNKKKPRIMSKYIDQVSQQINARLRGDLLEESISYAISSYLKELQQLPNVTISATSLNKYGKQIKSDVTWEINDTIEVGISAKNYIPQNGKDVTVTLHSAGQLENFYKLVEEMNLSGITGRRSIMTLIRTFRSPEFKYHLINQAAQHNNKRIGNIPAGENLINFIKMFLPLFIGAQFKIQGDTINVDFFNIDGYFIPVSTIIEDVFYGGKYTGLKIGLYSNYTVPWMQMTKEKLEAPVNGVDYYSQDTQKVGSIYGHKVYDNIKTGRVHLKVALSNLKSRG